MACRASTIQKYDLELASRRWRRGRRDVCFGWPERENVPGHLVGQTRDGGEQGVGSGSTAENERQVTGGCRARRGFDYEGGQDHRY